MVIRIAKQVSQIIDIIRPALEAEGSGIELLKVDQNRGVVQVRFRGICASTPQALETLRMGVEEAIKKEVPRIKEVLSVSS